MAVSVSVDRRRLVVGPGVSRLVHALVAERRERIRADERAEVAAHLHDSVLQTLALVQRRADEPREVVRLARMQERELRAWLLSGDSASANGVRATSLGVALEELAASIETEHGVPVEVVRVRDCGIDGTEPLLAAAREAILNAVRHSGAATFRCTSRSSPTRPRSSCATAGRGFDPGTVPADRGGISHSIVGRMTRAGGRAEVRSIANEGTEVELALSKAGEPRSTNHAHAGTPTRVPRRRSPALPRGRARRARRASSTSSARRPTSTPRSR